MMTPQEIKDLLQEEGFYSQWQGRHLVGGSDYTPGNPGKFEGKLFTLTFLDEARCEAQVKDFQGKVTPAGPNDLEIVVPRLLELLTEGREAFSQIQPATLFRLGQLAPKAKTEAGALEVVLWGDLIPPKGTVARQVIPETKLSHVLCGEGPPKFPTTEDFRAIPEEPDWDLSKRLEALNPDKLRPVRKPGGDRDFDWRPLAELETWPHRLMTPQSGGALWKPLKIRLVTLVSAIYQGLSKIPDYLDLLVFSSEPEDGWVTACVATTKTEPDHSIPKPQWLVDLLKTYEKLDEERDLPRVLRTLGS